MNKKKSLIILIIGLLIGSIGVLLSTNHKGLGLIFLFLGAVLLIINLVLYTKNKGN